VFKPASAALGAALLTLSVPAVAGAATKNVVAGPPIKKAPAGVPKDGDVNAFFPTGVKVHVGDKVKFTIAGFHAVNFVKKGDPAPGLTEPFPGGSVSGAKDAAGQDFWFNGQAQLILNPTLVSGTKSPATYDGTKAVASGAPLGAGAPKPWLVRFSKAGSYTFYCPIHPGMEGKVTVVAKNKRIPSAKADAARAKTQLASALTSLKKLDKKAAPTGDVVVAGPDSKADTLFRYTPAKKTVKAGTTLTLTMTQGTRETHTFTFSKDTNELETLAKNFIAPLPGTGTNGPPALGLAAAAVYPSEPKDLVEDGAVHGTGFVNTGALDGSSQTPLPLSAKVTFTAPGTYHYICLIHPEMKGEVDVTP
jgi:plastocyanin